MNVCVTVNSKYMRYLYIMLQSLYENNARGAIDLYVIQRDFTDDDKEAITKITQEYGNRVSYIWVDEHKYDNMPIYNLGRSNLSLEIYFRLLIPEYLPEELDRVLMLDVDIVVNKDISELYNIDFEDCYLAAAPNMCHNLRVRDDWRAWYGENRTNWTHYNTGILMWNLEKIRKDFPREYIFNLAWKYPIKTATFEEELFNVEFGECGIKEIPADKWNYISTHATWFAEPRFVVYQNNEEILEKCAILHYAALNPWQGGVKNDSFKLWWKYAKQTPYYPEIIEECYWTSENFIKNMHTAVDNQEKKLIYVDVLLDEKYRNQVVERLEERRIKKLMIYGAGRVAKCIHNILKETNIEVLCYIDKVYRGEFCGKETIDFPRIADYEQQADVILISNSYYYNEIVADLKPYTECEKITIDDLLREEN